MQTATDDFTPAVSDTPHVSDTAIDSDEVSKAGATPEGIEVTRGAHFADGPETTITRAAVAATHQDLEPNAAGPEDDDHDEGEGD